MVMERTGAPAGMSQSLRGEYWKLVFPGYDESRGVLPHDSLTCTGSSLWKQPGFSGTLPFDRVGENDITIGGGADGIRAVWLRSHKAEDGSFAGALALVRAKGELASVFAVGASRARPKARLSLERIGTELVLLLDDDGCTGKPSSEPCDHVLKIHLVRQGRLVEAARVMLEQVDFDNDSEPPSRGRFRYHLMASPSFVQGLMRLSERVSVRDSTGREVRWAELDRVFRVEGDRLAPGDDPLWDRVYKSALAAR